MSYSFNSCAKLILTGEHAVVYGHTAIATHLPLEMKVHVYHQKNHNIFNEDFVLLKNCLNMISCESEKYKELIPEFLSNYNLEIESFIPKSSGFGSSAALSICAAKIVQFIENNFKIPEKYDNGVIVFLANKIEKIFHKTPSGIDVAASLSKTILRFNSCDDFESIENNSDLYLAIINTGPRNVLTKNIIENLHQEKNDYYFKMIGEIGNGLKNALEICDYKMISETINENYKILKSLGIVTEKMQNAVDFIIANGAIAAKSTGAGLGGAVFGLFQRPPNIKQLCYCAKMPKD